MRKELNKFQRITDGAFFAVDLRAFESTISFYDPLVANQTLLATEREETSEQAPDRDERRDQDAPNPSPLSR